MVAQKVTQALLLKFGGNAGKSPITVRPRLPPAPHPFLALPWTGDQAQAAGASRPLPQAQLHVGVSSLDPEGPRGAGPLLRTLEPVPPAR